MKKFVVSAAVCAAALTVSNGAFAQASANVDATGSTTIIQPITITKNADLAFGRIVKPSTGTGTVAIANSADSVTAGSGAAALGGIATSRAKFTVDGEGGQAISFTIGSLSMTNGTDTISVTLNPDITGSVNLSGSLASAGSASLNVGGSFSVPNAISTGTYSGTFNVAVSYN